MTANEKKLITIEMKELEALMTIALNFEVHMFSASSNVGEEYQCLPADRDNAFCSWYCSHGFDTFKKTPKDACYYLAKKLREFMRLDKTKKNTFRYLNNPMLPDPIILQNEKSKIEF